MSKYIATAVLRGTQNILKDADILLKKAIAEKGPNYRFDFPDTAFALPLILCFTGKRIETLGQMQEALDYAKSLVINYLPSEKIWLPFLGEALDAGVATMFAEEIIEAVRYIYGTE
ncbi:CO dehydrogenase/CO-methylating acetyl-CoA synthase complex subunit beta, partial [Candidatus Desantisbacteria bacterium]|nr:CO dehydrogenase/CO-methylating acetyl-CoA synthase complex subunit beta [Candidatus Desantisbacteria bacterium]